MAIALASASQDIAIDAYAVEVLHKDEQGAAAGARTAIYRAALLVSGGVAISLAARIGWPAVNALLAFVYLPMLVITWKSPEPEVQAPPPQTLSEAVWQPFLSFLTRPRALEILAFVVLYKLADQLAQALTRPFLIDMGYNADQRGIALATIGVAGNHRRSVHRRLGHDARRPGALALDLRLPAALLERRILPAVAFSTSPTSPAMYAATGFELLTSGMGTGAFSVLLLRLTEKRFSATQYALFSSLFALPRVLAGPITGFAVDAIGWSTFFLSTIVIGIPGLLMLGRFVPLGVREPKFDDQIGRPAPARRCRDCSGRASRPRWRLTDRRRASPRGARRDAGDARARHRPPSTSALRSGGSRTRPMSEAGFRLSASSRSPSSAACSSQPHG